MERGRAKTIRRRLLPPATAAALMLAPASALAINALCVTNSDPDHAHRIVWLHQTQNYAVSETVAQPGETVCYESPFLRGAGWSVKAVVKLYDDHEQTAGREFEAGPFAFSGPSKRRQLCFRYDSAAFRYLMRQGPCE